MSIKFITCNNLKALTSIRHGFFTRKGGSSCGIYESLNCGPGSGDLADNVQNNRLAAMQALGFGANNLYSLYQIHSDKAIHISSAEDTKYEADALVTNTKGLALGILTADCTPILFADVTAGVIGAAHAGWRGAKGGIIENTILKMEEIGAQRKNIIVAIGPTISHKSYEVGQEFYDNFILECNENLTFFTNSSRSGHFMFNLPLYVAARLHKFGITKIEDCQMDTCSDAENFFSYRRNSLQGIKDYGRNLSIIGMA